MQKAKFFLDTEFIESGPNKPIQLISIGIDDAIWNKKAFELLAG